jgi:hypothetical protein
VNVDDIVVGVARADLVFELVVEREGVKKCRVRRDIQMLKRTLSAS